jgi:hypothetical protein
MAITAALSIALLLGVVGWQFYARSAFQGAGTPIAFAANASDSDASSSATWEDEMSALASTTPSTDSTSSDPITAISTGAQAEIIGAYTGLTQNNAAYNATAGQSIASSIASNLNVPISYPAFATTDIKTDPDTSYDRMLTYRSDLRVSLAPLLKNTQPEFQIFAEYVQTNDPQYLTQLEAAAANYRAAASSTAKVVVPIDAITYQVGILNAMEEFAATLDAMAAHATDPIASAILLKNYNQAEQDMLTAFNNLATYEKNKQQP